VQTSIALLNGDTISPPYTYFLYYTDTEGTFYKYELNNNHLELYPGTVPADWVHPTGFGVKYDHSTNTWLDNGVDDPATITRNGDVILCYSTDGNLFFSFIDPYYA
jgi:hypothetical protein